MHDATTGFAGFAARGRRRAGDERRASVVRVVWFMRLQRRRVQVGSRAREGDPTLPAVSASSGAGPEGSAECSPSALMRASGAARCDFVRRAAAIASGAAPYPRIRTAPEGAVRPGTASGVMGKWRHHAADTRQPWGGDAATRRCAPVVAMRLPTNVAGPRGVQTPTSPATRPVRAAHLSPRRGADRRPGASRGAKERAGSVVPSCAEDGLSGTPAGRTGP